MAEPIRKAFLDPSDDRPGDSQAASAEAVTKELRVVVQLDQMIAECEQRALAIRTPDATRLVDTLRRTAQRVRLSAANRAAIDAQLAALDAKVHRNLAELALVALWGRSGADKAARLDSLEAFRRWVALAVPAEREAEALRRDLIGTAVTEAFAEIEPLADVGDRAAIDDAGMRLGCLLRDPAVERATVTDAARRLKELVARADAARAKRDAVTAALEGVLRAAIAAEREGDAEARDQHWARFRDQAKPHLTDPLDAEFRKRAIRLVSAEVEAAIGMIPDASQSGDLEAAEALAGWARGLFGERLLFDQPQRERFGGAVRAALRNMYMLATDRCLDEAFSAARSQDKAGRAQLARQGRRYIAQALVNGAAPEFAELSAGKFELVSETGVEQHDGPTRAKPADQTAKPYNAAKADKRGARRYARPVFTVEIAERQGTSIDWSLSGMRLACRDLLVRPLGLVPISIVDPRRRAFDCAVEVIHVGDSGDGGCVVTIRFQSKLAPLRQFLRACAQR